MIPLLAVALALTTNVTAPEPPSAREVTLDGVQVRLGPDTRQVVTANHTSGHHARITSWVLRDGRWHQTMQATDGRIGYGGLVAGPRRHQGTGTTPLGSYALRWAFGTHDPNPRWELGYREIRSGDYWVQDNASKHYNRYRNKRLGGFRWRLPSSDPNSSERLTDYPVQYEWSIVPSYNRPQVRYRGSGLFLHVNGSGATAGCVSAPRWFIKSLMSRLDPDKSPVIAVGR